MSAAPAFRPGRARGRSSRRGLALVEVLVAATVMVVALLPLFVMLSSSVRTTEVSVDELIAVNLAHELMSQMQLVAYEPGFGWIPSAMPDQNPPPDFPRWVAIHEPDAGFFQEGLRLPHPLTSGNPDPEDLDTDDWTKIGAPLAGLDTVPPDPLIQALSRIHLSKAPESFERYVKVFLPRLNRRGDRRPDLKRIEVRVDWSRDFLGDAIRTRSLQLTTLVGNPRMVVR